MKRIAVISDIHANIFALNAVIKDKEFTLCDDIIFCGDAVGYYYEAESVIRFLRQNDIKSVIGNHDFELLNNLKLKKYPTGLYERKYGSGLKIAQKTLTEDSIEWLKSLPESFELFIENISILVTHSFPLERDGYIYPDCSEEVKNKLFSLGHDCILFGHSHFQFSFEAENKFIINPGSVGQPRDTGGYAGWAIIMIIKDKIDITFKRTEYDISEVVAQTRIYNPEVHFLQEVLWRNQ